MSSVEQIYAASDQRAITDHQALWRYVPLRTLMFYLTGNIFIPSIQMLAAADPFEGKFHFDTTWFNTVMKEKYGDRLESIEEWIYRDLCDESERKHIEVNKDYVNYGASVIERHYFAFRRKTRYAWCWFLSDSESAAMWNNYGNGGVAIASTVGKIRMLLANTEHAFVFGQMRYIRLVAGEAQDFEFNPELNEDAAFLLKPEFLKRSEYQSEKEVRFVTAAPERAFGAGLILSNLDPTSWITEIRLWPGLKPPEQTSIQKVVEKFTNGIPCACSDLLGHGPYSDDGLNEAMFAYLDSDNWRRWKEGTDNVPPELKQV
jgi:hypothetical protein